MIGNIRHFTKIRLTSLSTKRAVDVFLDSAKIQHSKKNILLLSKEKIPNYKELYKDSSKIKTSNVELK